MPLVVDASVPILVGEANEPVSSDNCAVKILGPLKGPQPTVYGTFTASLAQNGEPAIAPVVIVMAFIVKAALFEPVIEGLELITLILYADAVGDVAWGMVALIVPFVVDARVPIVVGAANDPVSSDNCAVKMFAPPKSPTTVYGTLTAAAAQ